MFYDLNMKEFVLFVLLMGFVIWRYPPQIKNIYPGTYVVDSFVNCSYGSFTAPTKYSIKASSSLVVELLNTSGYNNMTDGLSYEPINRYQLMRPTIYYHINLTRHYHKINGTCYIALWNNNPYVVAYKWRYIYRPIWDYISSILRENGGIDLFLNTYN